MGGYDVKVCGNIDLKAAFHGYNVTPDHYSQHIILKLGIYEMHQSKCGVHYDK